jgi:polyisoprenoid-binding protein YceI
MKSTILILLAGTTALFGQETVLELNPAQSHVEFTLSDVLHTVHGSFKLKRGTVHYDFVTRKCSGQIVIDAQSGDSGSEARDKKMHHNILESDRYPEIVFTADHVEGTLSKASIHGLFRIHGKEHEMTTSIKLSTAALNGFQSQVALSASGLPAGVTASFAPATISAPGSGASTLTLAAASETIAGSYNLTVTAIG